jgi:hypothetical protein
VKTVWDILQDVEAWPEWYEGAKDIKLITDESFRGPLGLLQGTFIPNKLHGLHQIFLEELKKKAETKSNRYSK